MNDRWAPRRAIALLLAALGAALGVLHRWTADDAFISFRYARNLIEGEGLTFNAGERVEGYTNFLWTLLCAAGLALGADVELWAQALGIAAYAGLIAWLALRAPERSWPLAALGLCFHPDLWVFSTSGLETALFSLLGTMGLALALDADRTSRRLSAGVVLGLCVLCRPDGAIFAVLGVIAPLLSGKSRSVRDVLELALPVACLVGAQLAFRLLYYGAWLPNTYYAKSAALAWYEQGLVYAGFFAQRSWALLAAALVAAACLARLERGQAREAGVFAAAALLYAAYVVRVGGDFMFARLLLPAVPPLLVFTERASRSRPRLQAGLCGLLLVGLSLTPQPDGARMWRHGIVDERAFVDRERDRPERARTVARYFAGLPVRVAFTGGDARLVYRARIPYAIESESGLNDHFIAHLPLARRGRPGHEKPAPLEYLVRDRRVDFTFRTRGLAILDAGARLPPCEVWLDDIRIFCLRWDPPLMSELGRRGARFEPFEARLDAMIARLPSLTDLEVARQYAAIDLFYFAHVDDPARRARFTERLATAPHPLR